MSKDEKFIKTQKGNLKNVVVNTKAKGFIGKTKLALFFGLIVIAVVIFIVVKSNSITPPGKGDIDNTPPSKTDIDNNPSDQTILLTAPQVKVPVDLEVEENEQKSVDEGHSPWKLDPAFVAQVFVSLKISPEGITGDYPIKNEDVDIIESDNRSTVAVIKGDKTPIKKVYMERLIRQDSTGIWTVVGYDPVK